MWKSLAVAALLVVLIGCKLPFKVPQLPQPAKPQIAVMTVQVTPVHATVTVAHEDGRVIRAWTTRDDGTIVEEFEAGKTYLVTATADGFLDSSAVTVLATEGRMKPVVITLAPVPKPVAKQWCSIYSEDQLRSVRADLGGVRLPFETSASRRTNYMFSPTYVTMTTEQRGVARAEHKARGYTHFIVGPLYEKGYPGWAGHDFRQRIPEWVALMEELWNDNLIPMLWVFPDGPYNAQVGEHGSDRNPPDYDRARREFLPILQHPELQRVHCNVTLGWEVTDNGWIKTIKKARQGLEFLRDAFPTAFRGWHGAVDNGAPCNYDEDGYGCEAKAWLELTPLMHYYFWQTGAAGGWNLAAGRVPENRQDRLDQFKENLAYEINRFHGNHYRPGGLFGADGKPIDIIVGEYSAYFELNDGESEEWGRSWGTLALTFPGVRGFGDGGGTLWPVRLGGTR